MLLAINYHYIDDESRFARGIYPVSSERLADQIGKLGSHFQFVGEREILAALDGTQPLPERSCVVTFDDGLRGQYTRAFPVLRKMGVPAVFYIGGLPYKDRRGYIAHKIHWVRAMLPPEEFLEKIRVHYREHAGKDFSMEMVGASDEAVQKQYLYDDLAEARLKYLLNKSTLFPDEMRTQVVESIFAEIEPDESVFCDSFYLQADEIREISATPGYSVGLHGYAHRPLATLPGAEIRSEIQTNIDALRTILGPGFTPRTISYPYGSPALVSRESADIAQQLGMKFGFTMERALNKTLTDPLLLARLDANDVPGGKAPLFEIVDEVVVPAAGRTLVRSSYGEPDVPPR